MKKFSKALLGILFLTFSGGSLSAQLLQDDHLTAHYLAHFIGFVDWEEWGNGKDPTIGILGAPDIERKLEEISQHRRNVQRGAPFEVRRVGDKTDLGGLQVLYVGDGYREVWSELSDVAAENQILLIGREDDFARQAGVIEFVTRGNQLRFSVNQTRASDLNIRLSSKLLTVAVEVL